MSYPLNVHGVTAPITEKTIASDVALALREHHCQTDAVVKRIARATGVSMLTVRKWYEGRSTPKSSHLMVLAQTYPAIQKLVVQWVGILGENLVGEPDHLPSLAPLISPNNADKFVRVNVWVPIAVAGKLNERQLWFLGQLQQNITVRGDDIARIWSVAPRTARRDITSLVEMGLVKLVGADKNGHYIYITSV